MLLCPSCHSSYRAGYVWESSAPICFTPCTEILQYLEECITGLKTTNADKILDDLRSNPPETEAAKKAKSFVDCFEIYLLADIEYCIATQYLPLPCKLDATGTSFIPTDTIIPGFTFRIFEAKTISETTAPTAFANISLNPLHVNLHTDQSRLLWRMEGCSAGAVLAFLIPLSFPHFIRPKSTLLKRALDRFLLKMTVITLNPAFTSMANDISLFPPHKEYVGPASELTPSEIVPDDEMAIINVALRDTAL
ncbi:hypothetical protein CPB85DRAFT_1323743 [Mucidula mucida]|nr:hypothetical protein CPB85DRAFT_1323743 [Mucidula mucida]